MHCDNVRNELAKRHVVRLRIRYQTRIPDNELNRKYRLHLLFYGN